MSSKLTRVAYEKLIVEDLEVLEALRPEAIRIMRRLELDHRALLTVLQDIHDSGSNGLPFLDMLFRMAEIDTEKYPCG